MAIKIPLPDGIPPRTTIGATSIGNGVSLEWLDDGDVIIYTLTNTRREAVDTYINACLTTLENSDVTKPGRALLDISHPDIALTPYFRKRLPEIVTTINKLDMDVFSAVVFDNGFLQTLLTLFGNTFTRPAKRMKQRYFTDYDKALEWVRKETLT
ncbi:MAG: hypothetical protein SFZ02_17345 [bacterium]|nr:hypothetical protein [bacterium]